MSNNRNTYLKFLTTAIVTGVVVFVLSMAAELDLLFRSGDYVTKRDLNLSNLVKFATIEQLEKREKNEPNNYIVKLKLAKLHDELGNYKEANRLYKDAVNKSGRSDYTLYNYALFCAKQGLYTIAASFAEDISSNSKKNINFKAKIFNQIADTMYENKEYLASVSAYQIAYKYAKNSDDKKFYEEVKDKYACAYIKLADEYVKNNLIKEAISALNNSVEIKETQLAQYKLGLIYIESDKELAQRLIEKVFKNEPYLVNPYIYTKLLDDLINENLKTENKTKLNYYSVKQNSFKEKMSNIYVYKNDVIISNTKIFKKKDDYYLVFDLKNNTNKQIEQLYLDIDLHLNSRWYRLTKKIVRMSKVLHAYDLLEGYVIKLPSSVRFVDVKDNNYLIVKYYAKKSLKAPSTLVQIDSLNF